MNKRFDHRLKGRPELPLDKETLAGSRLPYGRHIDELTVQTRDGLLLQFIQLDGLPFETADTEEINYRKALRDGAFRALANSRFALYHHVLRREVSPDMQGAFPDDFSRSLDDMWRSRLSAKKLYVNDLFLTIVRRPLQGRAGLLEGFFKTLGGEAGGGAQAQAARAIDLRELNAARESLLASLAPYGARSLSIYNSDKGFCSEPLEFLSALYNGEMRPVLMPKVDLGRYLP
jgi:type IV secretion system protein VirB4